MANQKKRVPENVPSEFFVDSTCIDCDACRQIAPSVFGEAVETSFVKAQPKSSAERRQVLQALLACPTGSIGCLGDDDVKAVMHDFPLVIEEPVFYCGFNSPKSYGGNSYFVQHAAGNWLIDSPKYVTPLVKRLEALGGIANIFLTHRDDVADAGRYAEHFGSRRFIHRAELSSQPNAEVVLDGNEPLELAPGFLAIPTPGHTEGHCVLLFQDRFLFTGDHLDWDRDEKRLAASENYCWFSWPQQAESMARLIQYRLEWVLPGHGQRIQLPADKMHQQLAGLVERMRK
jgi:glyoxylase-like metal-dependent hydrolase (beta-lactamase superfamily II)/ferredoxin